MQGIDILLLKDYIDKVCPSERGFIGQDLCTNTEWNSHRFNHDKCLKCWKFALDKNYSKERSLL